MDYAHAAQAALEAISQKFDEPCVSLSAVEAVEIDEVLYDPMASPELAQHVVAQAVAQERQLFASF